MATSRPRRRGEHKASEATWIHLNRPEIRTGGMGYKGRARHLCEGAQRPRPHESTWMRALRL